MLGKPGNWVKPSTASSFTPSRPAVPSGYPPWFLSNLFFLHLTCPSSPWPIPLCIPYPVLERVLIPPVSLVVAASPLPASWLPPFPPFPLSISTPAWGSLQYSAASAHFSPWFAPSSLSPSPTAYAFPQSHQPASQWFSRLPKAIPSASQIILEARLELSSPCIEHA